MTDSPDILIAQAVADLLNAAQEESPSPFSQPFTCERLYLVEMDLGDFADIHVAVVPADMTTDQYTRNRMADGPEIQIGVRKKIAAQDPAAVKAELDALRRLTHEIGCYLELRSLAGEAAGAKWLSGRHRPIFIAAHMSQKMRQYTAMLSVTYRWERKAGEP